MIFECQHFTEGEKILLAACVKERQKQVEEALNIPNFPFSKNELEMKMEELSKLYEKILNT